MLGNTLLGSSKWMVSIEGRVVCVLDSESNFAAALSVIFSIFYVFNIEYQEPASATLELIQRFLVRINPEGTKCTAKAGVTRKTGKVVQRKPLPIDPHVTHFLADLNEFEWKNSQHRPGCEEVCAVIPALELMLGQWKEEMAVMVELSQLSKEHSDPHSASVVKSRVLGPLVPRVKLLGDLLTNARRVGCTIDRSGGFGEYLINQLQEELTNVSSG
ncbi:uncharacterized protein ACWYII_041777 isoform 2-T2 [Salvelinus alpinus]